MTPLLAGVAGMLLGLVAGCWLLRRSAADRAVALYERWRIEEIDDIARSSAAEERRATKATASAGAGWGLPGLAADARFVGDPIHLVLFDGDSEIKAGSTDSLRSVTFVAVGDAADADLVEECVAAGRVRWETLRIPTGPAP